MVNIFSEFSIFASTIFFEIEEDLNKMIFYIKAAVIILTVVLFSAASYYVYDWRRTATFLRNLPGEIVFNQRDGNNLNVYTISADGKNKKLVFANNDKTNSNSISPKWNEDKSKIRFAAMKDGKWQTFVVNPDGSDLQILNVEHDTVSRNTSSGEIRVERGSLYVRESDGRETLLYSLRSVPGYDPVFNSGASEAGWSPDKQYVVFESCAFSFCGIMIADRTGENIVKLTDGTKPDWK